MNPREGIGYRKLGAFWGSAIQTLRDLDYEVVSLDNLDAPFTNRVGSNTKRLWVRRSMRGVQAVFHAATLE